MSEKITIKKKEVKLEKYLSVMLLNLFQKKIKKNN